MVCLLFERVSSEIESPVASREKNRARTQRDFLALKFEKQMYRSIFPIFLCNNKMRLKFHCLREIASFREITSDPKYGTEDFASFGRSIVNAGF